ncbi:MAG TPA: PLDc N-terminal domain-containing protein [Acidimicrobiales bacterium]|nr:PLDc N-terminal domain-containing protein [Acidimicrobiales bacterium]
MDNVGSAIGGIFLLALLLAAIGFWIWSLVDAIRVPDGSFRAGNKVVWVVVIAVTGFLGSVVYLFAGRPRAA